jgi:hypothetical protein
MERVSSFGAVRNKAFSLSSLLFVFLSLYLSQSKL